MDLKKAWYLSFEIIESLILKGCMSVQDLNALKLSYRSQNHRSQHSNPIRVNIHAKLVLTHQNIRWTTRTKVLKIIQKARILEGTFRPSPIIKYYKCQSYGHIAANCLSLVRIFIDKLLVIDPEPDSEEFIYLVEEPEGSGSDEKTTDDNVQESNTSIPFEVTPMIREFTNVFSEGST